MKKQRIQNWLDRNNLLTMSDERFLKYYMASLNLAGAVVIFCLAGGLYFGWNAIMPLGFRIPVYIIHGNFTIAMMAMIFRIIWRD